LTARNYYWTGASDGDWNVVGNWRTGCTPGTDDGDPAAALPGLDPENYEDTVHFVHEYGDPGGAPPEVVAAACTTGPSVGNAAVLAGVEADADFATTWAGASILFANVTAAELVLGGDGLVMEGGTLQSDCDLLAATRITGGTIQGDVTGTALAQIQAAGDDVVVTGDVTFTASTVDHNGIDCAGTITIVAADVVQLDGLTAPQGDFSGAGLAVVAACEIDLLEFADGDVQARTGEVLNWRSGTMTLGGGDITNAMAVGLEAPGGVIGDELRIYGSVALDVDETTVTLRLLMTQEARATDYDSGEDLPDGRRILTTQIIL
jgi:hypothetical protein